MRGGSRAGPLTAGLLAVGVFASVCVISLSAVAQESTNPFGGFKHDKSAPIEITSDALEVRQAEQLAIFSGDVVAGQGTLRLTADRVEVVYDTEGEESDTGVIRDMRAEGNVFISNGSETAQGKQARYDVENGTIRMTGDVVLTQGQNVISGQELTIDLDLGQGRVESGAGGRVKSIFTPRVDASE